ncbi:DUF4166 domain-containing protein [Agrobacterium vaccinii]|uniref:SDR family oxidoreductase n=1 Tax=Agrobacterium vaccinii TaxID=2735528 RepID=UPI001E351279|nr:SDR family oxidoreductase [Agrobacterium vaccinii]UHS60736.1 DUF4166 domain-containing protein [Agrobacterium vaccinii]
MKILILGGYGVFGGRLAQLLGDIDNLEILIGGRNLSKAVDFCATYRGKSKVRPLKSDRDQIDSLLQTEQPELLVDASGPFQNYGPKPYGVIEACITHGVNYVDFSDSSDFVLGVSQYDAAANAAGIFVLSGVSSFPVLTAAVLREMAKTMDIISVRGGIAPSPFAGIGLNVMRAVVGYAGEPVKLWRNGKQAHAPGLTESMRYTIAAPGKLPLKNIHFSLVDVPDLQVIPPEHPSLQNIWMGAGPVPEILHRVLNVLAKVRSRFPLPSLVPLSRLFYTALNVMKFGEHRGGMFVHAIGTRNEQKTEQSWHLLAEGDDGPYIPSMAIEIIIRKLLSGIRPATGARPATRALELADYEQIFSTRSIFAGFRGAETQTDPVYKQVLGPRFETLPETVKALHDSQQARSWQGSATVKRGRSAFARLICKFMKFPQGSDGVPVQVVITPGHNCELWTRTFGQTTFSSRQSVGSGRNKYLVLERFGATVVALACVVEDDKLYLVPRRWSLFGIPFPVWLLGKEESFEMEQNGNFCFHVNISLRGIGLIVSYQGHLRPTR